MQYQLKLTLKTIHSTFLAHRGSHVGNTCTSSALNDISNSKTEAYSTCLPQKGLATAFKASVVEISNWKAWSFKVTQKLASRLSELKL